MSESRELIPYEEVRKLAADVAKSALFKAFRTPEQAIVLMMLAQAEGCHPIQALQRYDVIDGKPAKKTDAMLADYQARGGTVEWLVLTDVACRARFSAKGAAKPVEIEWTIAQAKTAGLTGKDNWRNYPRAMLRARVISEGIRVTDPYVVAGQYSPEEVQDMPHGREQPTIAPTVVDPAEVNQAPAVPAEQIPQTPARADLIALKALSNAIAAAGLCELPELAEMTPVERKAAERGARLAWCNHKLVDAGEETVTSAAHLTPQQAKYLIEQAKEGASAPKA